MSHLAVRYEARPLLQGGSRPLALERDPTLIVVEQALRQRNGDPAAVIAEDGITRVLALVRQELSLVPTDG
jgi:hypothetical protein